MSSFHLLSYDPFVLLIAGIFGFNENEIIDCVTHTVFLQIELLFFIVADTSSSLFCDSLVVLFLVFHIRSLRRMACGVLSIISFTLTDYHQNQIHAMLRNYLRNFIMPFMLLSLMIFFFIVLVYSHHFFYTFVMILKAICLQSFLVLLAQSINWTSIMPLRQRVTVVSWALFAMFTWNWFRFDFYRDKIVLRPQHISNSPEIIRRLGLITMNAAVEVSLRVVKIYLSLLSWSIFHFVYF